MDVSPSKADRQPERRRASRTALRLDATIEEPGGGQVEARLIDISAHGCRIEVAGSVAPEDRLSLGIAGLEPLQCRIVWRCEEFAGLEFAEPLDETVLDSLLQGQEQVSESTIGELRDIAERTYRLARKQSDADIRILAELSQQCAVEAVVEGFRLGESRRTD